MLVTQNSRLRENVAVQDWGWTQVVFGLYAWIYNLQLSPHIWEDGSKYGSGIIRIDEYAVGLSYSIKSTRRCQLLLPVSNKNTSLTCSRLFQCINRQPIN